METEHIVVDGSNIATEGRSLPSLAQLEEAVGELRREYPDAEVTVIVDATFAHRIDPSELGRFETAVLSGEYVHPPAGAIGRGDAFLLRIAERVDAVVLSNDSFQEFHGEHPWLFDRGRLLGATPVPGVGWIFTPRRPVRGATSRKAVQSSKDSDKARRRISKAIEAATKEAVDPSRPAKKPQRTSARPLAKSPVKKVATSALVATAAAVNDPLSFVSFIAGHPLGTTVEGEVESYTSHGAVVAVGDAQCYLPLANMGTPTPRSAREVLKKGERRSFVVTALDPQRRGVELAVPGSGVVSGRPREETIAAELRIARRKAAPAKSASKKAAPAKKAAAKATGEATKGGTAAKARGGRGEGGSAAPPPASRMSEAPARAGRRRSKAAEKEQPDALAPIERLEPRLSPRTRRRS